jgi:hypothetical protein
VRHESPDGQLQRIAPAACPHRLDNPSTDYFFTINVTLKECCSEPRVAVTTSGDDVPPPLEPHSHLIRRERNTPKIPVHS